MVSRASALPAEQARTNPHLIVVRGRRIKKKRALRYVQSHVIDTNSTSFASTRIGYAKLLALNFVAVEFTALDNQWVLQKEGVNPATFLSRLISCEPNIVHAQGSVVPAHSCNTTTLPS
jgi:hypothetical protein